MIEKIRRNFLVSEISFELSEILVIALVEVQYVCQIKSGKSFMEFVHFPFDEQQKVCYEKYSLGNFTQSEVN